MDKDKALKVVKKAINSGAGVDLTFYGCKTKEEAEKVVDSFKNDFKKGYFQDENNKIKWISLIEEVDGQPFTLTAFYEKE